MAIEAVVEDTPEEAIEEPVDSYDLGEETPEEPETPKEPTVEEIAKDLGWRPKDEFQGDEDNYVDPATYIRRSKDIQQSMSQHLKDNRRKLDQMDKAVKESQERWSKHHWVDLNGGGPVSFVDDWSRINESGVEGDPLSATEEKGRIWSEAVIERLTEFMVDFRQRKILPRRNFNYVPGQ